MAQIVFNGNPLLIIRMPSFGAYIARRQVVTTFVLATPMLKSILRRLAKLTDRGIYAFTKLDVELHGSHAVFVRIHELSLVSPRIRPHLQGVSFSLRLTTMREILDRLRVSYCGTVGYEYMHISDRTQRIWIQQRVEPLNATTELASDHKRRLLQKLVEVTGYERYLNKKFVGTTRFGLDGGESTIVALEEILEHGVSLGVTEVVFGMAHRGRLKSLARSSTSHTGQSSANSRADHSSRTKLKGPAT